MKILIFNEKIIFLNQIDILAYTECFNLLIKNYYKLKYVLKIIIYNFVFFGIISKFRILKYIVLYINIYIKMIILKLLNFFKL